MSKKQLTFIKGTFLLLAGGTLPVAFMNFTSYLLTLVVNLFISIALALILY